MGTTVSFRLAKLGGPRSNPSQLGERVLRVYNSAETGYEKPHPEA